MGKGDPTVSEEISTVLANVIAKNQKKLSLICLISDLNLDFK